MWKWPWPRARGTPARGAMSGETQLGLEQHARTLRLELEERDRTLADLRRQIERQRLGEADRLAEALRAQLERVIAASATRITQLNTLAHLVDVEGKSVTARDVLANARGLLRVLEDEGMTLEGQPGDRVAFDPARHEPLQAGAAIAPGDHVEIRFSGVAFRGRSLRKAGVLRREA